jgi:polyphosphate glucokinase
MSMAGAEGRSIGVDIGGTGIKGAVVDVQAGAMATERVRIPTPQPATPERVAGVVVELLDQIAQPGAIGVTMPSVVLDGVIHTASNIDHAWLGVDAATLFAQATGRPVGVVNDADAAGIAEVRYGAGRDHRGVVVVITLGTGIGSAVFVDGDLVPNTELGHLPLHGEDAEDWAAESIREADDLSWKSWSHRVEKYLALVERLLWPKLIILGGGVSKKSDKFLPHIKIRTEVVAAQLHNDAGIVGAALFAPTSVTGGGG